MHQHKEVVDVKAFESHLKKETQLLKTWFLKKNLHSKVFHAGAEAEFLLLDKDFNLKPTNLNFVNRLNDPLIIPEGGASQLEINTKAQSLSGSFLSTLHRQLSQKWQRCLQLAKSTQAELLLMGSYPNKQLDYVITDTSNYWWMNDKAKFYRQGKPLSIAFDKVGFESDTLGIEGLICSFQLHLEVPQKRAAYFYEMIQILSAPLIALCANAPFFQNQRCWSESRISLFEQIYNFPTPYQNNVFLDCRNIKHSLYSLYSLFAYNLENYPRLFPQVDWQAYPEEMKHLRNQNSCIYRWNRPILDFNKEGSPYLRIEHRPLSSGPSLIDMVANAAFYYGLVAYFDKHELLPPLNALEIKSNFYEAAKKGLSAFINWNKHQVSIHELLTQFLPFAEHGLEYLEMDKGDIRFYLEVIKMRLAKKQNGSIWQQRFIENHQDFKAMLAHYVDYQNQDIPVAQWDLSI